MFDSNQGAVKAGPSCRHRTLATQARRCTGRAKTATSTSTTGGVASSVSRSITGRFVPAPSVATARRHECDELNKLISRIPPGAIRDKPGRVDLRMLHRILLRDAKNVPQAMKPALCENSYVPQTASSGYPTLPTTPDMTRHCPTSTYDCSRFAKTPRPEKTGRPDDYRPRQKARTATWKRDKAA
jgi:hypothetical protein